MKKIILIGRSESGKTTLTQALKGEKIKYHKTQYTNHYDVIIDTPGEYIQTKTLGAALAMYTFEADVVGLLVSATEPYSLFGPCITPLANRKHTINAGRAITIRMDAIIFVAPQVNLTASPIALIERHIKRIMTTSSNTSIPPISRFNWNDKYAPQQIHLTVPILPRGVSNRTDSQVASK